MNITGCRPGGQEKGNTVAITVTIRGFACSPIEVRNTQGGFVVGNFRMGSTHRKQLAGSNEWVDGDTSWFRVNVFRALASNAVTSIHKGDRIIVVGKLNVVSFPRKDGSIGTSVEIDAESIGPDLQFGAAIYTRTGSQRPAGEAAPMNSHGSAYSGAPSGLSELDRHEGSEGPGDQDDETGDGPTIEDSEQTPDSSDSIDGEDPIHADKTTGEVLPAGVPF